MIIYDVKIITPIVKNAKQQTKRSSLSHKDVSENCA